MERRIARIAVLLALGLVLALGTDVARAATETQKQNAIDQGLKYLAGAQQLDGRWETGGDDYDIATTAAAVLAFTEEGYKSGQNVVLDGTDYGDVVGDAVNYILSKAVKVTLDGAAPNPGATGVRFAPGHHETYATGSAMPAIIANNKPGDTVVVGGTTYTHKQVVQMARDYLEASQKRSGQWGYGGWGYDYNLGDARSDNSNSQWPTLGLVYAQQWGVTSPNAKAAMPNWINYIQAANGGSYYDNNFAGWGTNVARTGALVLEIAYAGGYTGSATDLQAALNFINSNWNVSNDYWNGHLGHPYSMWNVYKGLEGTIGLGDTTAITNMRAFNPATMDLDAGDTWNWYEDYCEWLVDAQAAGGYWGAVHYVPTILNTAWSVSMLQATEIPVNVIPEPVTMAGLVLGIGGLVGYLRKRK